MGFPIAPLASLRKWAGLSACLLLMAAPRAFGAAFIDPPVMVPPGDTGWVGTTSFYFDTGTLLTFTGRIMYTLDGSAPQKDAVTKEGATTYRYTPGDVITLDTTTVVRAIHVQGGNISSEVSYEFRRAKVPTPVARYGGNAHFYPTLPCSLTVGATKPAAAIHYTLNDASLGPGSPTYSGTPLSFGKTTTLRAYATAAGYEDSDPMRVDFTLDQVATPVLDPAPGSSYKTGALTLRMKSATSGAHIRYTQDATLPPEKWTLMTGDSITFPPVKDGDSIQLRVQAFVSVYQTSAIQAAKYFYLPAVAAPVFNPAPKTFYDTLWVRLSSATAGANIRYTDDGTTPTAASLDGSAPILLKRPDTLKARAFKDKHDPSAVATAAYIMRLSQPTSDKSNGEFTDSLTVHLGKANPDAAVFYTLDGSIPALQPNGTVPNAVKADPSGTVTISQGGTTVLHAIAVAAGVASDPATFTYTKQQTITKYSAPAIDPASREFIDTLAIRMTAADPGVEIRYTLTAQGRDPTQQDSLAVSGRPIRLDSSAVLRCRAFPRADAPLPRLLPSDVSEMKYTLRPSPPTASPQPGEPFPPGTVVVLKARAKGGVIHYTLDPNADPAAAPGFPDSASLVLNASLTLNAVTIVGSGANRAVSAPLTLHYDVYASAPSDTLAVNGTRPIAGGFAYQNQSPQPVLARVRTADGMGLSGFADVSLVVSLQAMDPGQVLKIVFTKPAGTRASLYRYAGGIVEFVTGKESFTLTQPGDYFTAVDVQPPTIAILKQIPREGDSTTVRIKITDNVANPSCEIASPGLKGGATTRKPDTAGIVNVNLKGEGTDPKPLWLRIVSRDAYDSSRMPPEPGGKIYAAQLWSKVSTPGLFVIGQGAGPDLWDLAGLPVGAGTGMRWMDLRKSNPGMQACTWRNGTYDSLNDSDLIQQGMAFWVGSHARHSGLDLPQLRAGESEADGTFRIRLKPGWNLVTSPSLDTLYWPITPAVSQAGNTPLKAPYRYARATPGKWIQTDTLAPWIGYFVHYYGTLDTLITLYSSAGARPAAKSAAGSPSPSSVGLVLAADGIPALRLGARPWARDGIGPEDEPRPPTWGKSASAWSRRGDGSLLTDLVRLQPGSAAQWQVVVDPGEAGLRELRVGQADLPPGFEAWAVSRARGLKIRLGPGTSVPVAPGFSDTLSIFAGTAEALAGIGELAHTPEGVQAVAYALERSRGQAVLRIDLPWNGRVEADVWTVAGRHVTGLRTGELVPGIYRLPLPSGVRAGALLLRLRIQGAGGSLEFSRLFAP